jgi:hypothetical protein
MPKRRCARREGWNRLVPGRGGCKRFTESVLRWSFFFDNAVRASLLYFGGEAFNNEPYQ